MQITDVTCCPVEREYHRRHQYSGGTATTAQHVLIKITADDDSFGLGEACPFPVAYAEEDQKSVLHVICDYLRPAILGKDPFDVEALESAMNQAIPRQYLAKGGIDIALYDLMARSLNVPLYKLIGGKFRERIFIAWSISIKETIEEAVAEATHFVNLGFQALKIKIGIDPKADLERVAAVRAAVGPDIKLRVDANEGYRANEALPILRKMEKYELECIEQPVPRWDLDGMARLTAALDTAIVADESVFTPMDAMNLIKHQAADMINVSPAKTGFTNSKRIVAISEAAGLSCMLGGLLEMGLATAASLHFACSTRNLNPISDIIGPLFIKGDILEDPIFSKAPHGGYWNVPAAIGLGVDLSQEWTHRLKSK